MGRRVTTVSLEANITGLQRGLRASGAEADATNRKVSSLERELQRLGAMNPKPNIGLVDADAKARIDAINKRLTDLGRKTSDARVDVQDASAQTKLSAIESRLLAIGNQQADASIDLRGIADAEAKLGVLEAELSKFDHQDYVAEVHVDGTARASRSASLLTDLIAGIGPAAVTSSAVAGGALIGLAGAFGTALAPAGLLTFAITEQVKQMKAQEKQITADFQKLSGLTKGTAAYQAQLQKVRAEQQAFNDQFGAAADAIDRAKHMMSGFLTNVGQNGLNQLIADAVTLATKVLPALEGVVEAAAGSVDRLVLGMQKWAQSPDAKALIAFLETRGPAAIEAFGSVAGNVGKGLLSLFMAFAPLQDSMLVGLQKITAQFAEWASHVGDTQGFQAFMQYVRTEGPKVWDTLGSVANALLAISTAAAPVGAATLPIIKALADALALIAKSPAGPAIFSIAAALAVMNRALTVSAAIKTSNIATSLANISGGAGSIVSKATLAKGAMLGLGIGMEVAASHIDNANSSIKQFLTVGGGIAAGAAFGPWGAAAGALAGTLQLLSSVSQQAAARQNELASAAQLVADTLNKETGAVTGATLATLQQQLASKGAYDDAQKLGISYDLVTRAAMGNKGAQAQLTKELDAAFHANSDNIGAVGDLSAITETFTGTIDENRKHIREQQLAIVESEMSLHPWRTSIAQSDKVLHQLGINLDGVSTSATGVTAASKPLEGAWQRQVDLLAAADTNATNYKLALDNLIDTSGNVYDSQRAVTQGYIDLAAAVKTNGTSLDDQTAKGNANIDMLKGQVDKIKLLLENEKAVGDSPRKLANSLQEQRKQLVANFIQMGFSRDRVKELLHTYGLTPHLIATLFDAVTDDANKNIADTQKNADDLGKTKPKVDVSADTDTAVATLNRFRSTAEGILAGIHDEPVNVTLTAQASKVLAQLNLPDLPAKADGGPVFGPGGPKSDSILARVSNNEHVMTAEEIMRLGHGSPSMGHRKMMALRKMILRGEFDRAGDLQPFADGGPVMVRPSVQSVGMSAAAGQVQGIFDKVASTLAAMLSSRADDWLTHLPSQGQLGPGGSLTPSQIVRGQDAAKSQVGKPYIWGGVGPDGYDCSGFQSYVLNSAMGFGNPYFRRGSTSTMPWLGSHPGLGKYTIGWTTDFGGSGIGHTAGNIGGLNVESYGGHGPATGGGARSPMDPHFYGHMYYDQGGVVHRGDTLVRNALPHAETMLPFPPERVLESMNGGVDKAFVVAFNQMAAELKSIKQALGGELKVYATNGAEIGGQARKTASDAVTGYAAQQARFSRAT